MTNILATAEALVDNGQYRQALLLYDQLVAAYPYAAQLLRRRALARRMTEDFAGALSDLDKIILQDPDNAVAYWQRGACRAHRLSRAENIPRPRKEAELRFIVEDYQAAVQRDPTDPLIWLATIEVHLLLYDWDSAIGNYAVCQAYTKTGQLRLIRAWLGCIAMTLAGDPVETNDSVPLCDESIRLRRSDWCVAEIDNLLRSMDKQGDHSCLLADAVAIHNQFLCHFDETPIRG